MPGRRLVLEEREEIALGVVAGESLASIGRRLGRPTSTVSRELHRHRRGDGGYRAVAAQRQADRDARRVKEHKLAQRPELAARVEAGLARKWSPRQISCRLRLEHPEDSSWWVSPEAIYHSLYVQGRGGLRAELTEALRTGRARRRPKGPKPGRGVNGRIVNPVLITERPAEVEDRAVPGDWEGDLILGRSSRSQIGVLVERVSRFVVLIHLPGDRRAETVRDALAAKITQLPTAMMRSITWDQGKELAQHAQFTIDSGVQIYFCDPHSPWQKGTAENTNGLLRQYFPKGMDLSTLTEADLDAVADELNGRPRMTLGYLTPSEKFAEFIATAA
jgi:transposase, IS30 family